MTKSEWKYIDMWAKKYKLVHELGGKCLNCGNTDFRILQFHHNDNKEFEYNSKKTCSYEILLSEMKKCKLLCPNCHAKIHYDKPTTEKNERGRLAKQKLLELKGQFSCIKCGYNEFIGALDFHHKNPLEKKFKFGDVKRCSKIEELGSILLEELKKCDVICRNCHSLEHIDSEKLENVFDLIINKQWRKNDKSPKEEIIKFHNEGYKNIEISRLLGVPRNTITYVLNNK